MRKGIHPQLGLIHFRCVSCSASWVSTSTKLDARREEFQGAEYPTVVLETCSNCHPFYTEKQTFIDTAGRVEKFQRRFRKFVESEEQAAARETAKETS